MADDVMGQFEAEFGVPEQIGPSSETSCRECNTEPATNAGCQECNDKDGCHLRCARCTQLWTTVTAFGMMDMACRHEWDFMAGVIVGYSYCSLLLLLAEMIMRAEMAQAANLRSDSDCTVTEWAASQIRKMTSEDGSLRWPGQG